MRKHTGKLASCGLALGLVLTAGCPSPQAQRLPDNGPDPILGADAPALPSKSGAVAQAGPAAQKKLGAPLPVTQQTSSVAEMAGGPLKGGRDTLAIPVTNAAGNSPWQAGGAGKTVQVSTPQPLAEGQTLKAVPAVSGGSFPLSLQQELDKRNVVHHDETTVPGGVRFRCFIGSPNGSEIRQLEVERSTLEEAVRAVLEAIDHPR